MYEVNYNSRTSYLRNHFYCRVQLDGLLSDAECGLLEITEFLV